MDETWLRVNAKVARDGGEILTGFHLKLFYGRTASTNVMVLKIAVVLIVLFSSVSATIDRSPSEEDVFKAFFKRQMAEAELIFTYESANHNGTVEIVGSAFLIDVFGAVYITTNRHVLDSIIIKGHKEFELRNRFGRQLLITSPIYYSLKPQIISENIPETIKQAMSTDLNNDLVLIPYSMEYFMMEPFKPSRRYPTNNETAIAYGNTEGQGFINDKEGIVNYISDFFFGFISGARKGNSGGPVLTLENEVIGMLSSGGGPQGPQGADQSICIRLDLDRITKYYYEDQFTLQAFPNDVVHYYTQSIVTKYTPKPHHSRDKNTPHLSMGLAVGNLRHADGIWDMKIRGNRRPLECYNWDVIPLERLMKLCRTYGQTVVEFIPKEWFETYYHDTIDAAMKAFNSIGYNYSVALRSRREVDSAVTREQKL